MTSAASLMLQAPFTSLGHIVKARVGEQPARVAISDETGTLKWSAADSKVDRVAARLQSDGVGRGGVNGDGLLGRRL